MQNRRGFLAQATVTLLLIPLSQLGCGTESSSGSCDGAASTSSEAQGHTHSICLAASELTSPPAGGVTITSSSAAGHTHSVTLSQAQLTTIAAGQSVTVTSSSSSGHSHDFSIVRAVIPTQNRAPGY